MTDRMRADRLLVERGLFESRARAQAAIAAGLVTADGRPVKKASDELVTSAVLTGEPDHPYVSRGGVKLARALDTFNIEIEDHVCLDVGSSTGGFSQVLVERGARRVYAVDVGRDQFHPSLRDEPRIKLFEETDIRRLDAARLPEKPDVVVFDVSFISLKLVLPAALALAAPRTHLLALVKPQFEAPRRAIKKGIVRDPAVHEAVCEDIAQFIQSLGCTVVTTFPAAITGGDGNQEFFIGAHRG